MKPAATILVADVHPALLASFGLTLAAAGCQVLTASDGVKGPSVLQSQSVYLILTDIAMRKPDGHQLCERVRENPQWVTIPSLFLTARAVDSDTRCAKELSADDYLSKPIQPEDLLAAVQDKLLRDEQLA